ncbi:MAG: hypothetical protein ACI4HI_07925 [Lachnospiraceae bacterium]
MKKKKIIIIVLVLAIVASASGGGIYAYGQYKDKKTVVDVYAYENLTEENYEDDGLTSSGIVTNDLSQNVKYDKEKEIVEICVKKGDKVKIGDPLVKYSTKSSKEDLEIQKDEINNIKNSIIIAEKQLQKLQNTKPIEDTPDVDYADNEPQADVPADEPTPDESDPLPEKEGDAYNIISTSAKSYDEDSDGSSKNPFRFLCTSRAYVTGEYLNFLRQKGFSAVFEVRKGNKVKGELITSWAVNGKTLEKVDDDVEFSVSTKEEVDRKQEEEEQRRIEEQERKQEAAEAAQEAAEAAREAAEAAQEAAQENQESYTAKELASAINEKQKELKDRQLDLKRAELEQKRMEKEANQNVVKAKINGVVKKAQDLTNLNRKQSVVKVMGSDGLYVTGCINELLLDQVKVGQEVNAMNYETQTPLQAKITEISPYPTSSEEAGYYGGTSNPNSSFYPFTAYIEDASNVHNGDQVELKIATGDDSQENSNTLYLMKSFVRKENNKYYVMKRGKDKRLVKQYVQVGKSGYGGYTIEVKSGVKSGDYLAFPYGKKVKEGARTKEASVESLYNY